VTSISNARRQSADGMTPDSPDAFKANMSQNRRSDNYDDNY